MSRSAFASSMSIVNPSVSLIAPALPPPGRRSHSGLAMLISRISRRILTGTIGRPPRRLDFQRQSLNNKDAPTQV